MIVKGEGLAFIEKNMSSVSDDCIEWPFAKNRDGYGRLSFEGKVYRAHVLMLEFAKGPAPGGDLKYVARHSCNNKTCVNPNHLHWGTQSDNLKDHHHGFSEEHLNKYPRAYCRGQIGI